ncbi:hypothetical protein [Aestuariispira insulae]|uniref:Hint domain-containing protein n=1 Tax=Aestuariispira insulae TaxID=1461337 RepID=A0A3D9HPH4_9PROT|nr:hypothetical protein [Aestuariispira insulae]RED51305.1 hypothetical protein DFP90_103105 [Aestuariispira insulae]
MALEDQLLKLKYEIQKNISLLKDGAHVVPNDVLARLRPMIPTGYTLGINFVGEWGPILVGFEGAHGVMITPDGMDRHYTSVAGTYGLSGLPATVGMEFHLIKGPPESFEGFATQVEAGWGPGIGVTIPTTNGTQALSAFWEAVNSGEGEFVDTLANKAPEGTSVYFTAELNAGFGTEFGYTWVHDRTPLHVQYPDLIVVTRNLNHLDYRQFNADSGRFESVNGIMRPILGEEDYQPQTPQEAFHTEVLLFRPDGTQVFQNGSKILPDGTRVNSDTGAAPPEQASVEGVAEFVRSEIKGKSLILGKHCFAAGTPVSMADGTVKPIEKIEVGDKVLSFDAQDSAGKGQLVPRTVTHRHINHNKLVIDFHGTLVTPDHLTLCESAGSDPVFLPLIDIIKNDGIVISEDGTSLRAATNCPVGSLEDVMVKVLMLVDRQNRELVESEIRAGTLLLREDGTTVRVLDCIRAQGMELRRDGYLVSREQPGSPEPLYWAGPVPDPEDYILRKSGLTLADLEPERAQFPLH